MYINTSGLRNQPLKQ